MHFAKVATVQFDNASSHGSSENTEKLFESVRGNPPKIKVLHQPPMSPDTNVNDLGFYNSMNKKLRQVHPAPQTRDELKKAVWKIWKAYDTKLLDDLYRAKKNVLFQITKVNEENVYDLHST